MRGLPVAYHVLEGDEYGDGLVLVLRLVDVDAVFVVNREHLLPDDGYDGTVPVVQLEVQPQDVAPELPAEPLDVRDVADEMEHLVGELELAPVRHADEVPLVQGEQLALDVGDLLPRGPSDIGLVAQGEEPGVRLVQDVPAAVRYVGVVVQAEQLGRREKRDGRNAEAADVAGVRLLPRLAEPVNLRENTHGGLLLPYLPPV